MAAVPAARPRLVELVGPAGAGKSTLAAQLPARVPGLRNGPSVWGLPRLDLLRAALELLPVTARAALSGHPFLPAELAQMIRLTGLRGALERQATGADVILLDEGPVFALAWLEVFFEANGARQRNEWRRKAREEWAGLLDGVVRVDADDRLIVRRIRSREKPHLIKHSPDDVILGFTQRFRDAFDQVIEQMSTGGLEVRAVPSTDGDVQDDVTRLQDAIEASILNGR